MLLSWPNFPDASELALPKPLLSNGCNQRWLFLPLNLDLPLCVQPLLLLTCACMGAAVRLEDDFFQDSVPFVSKTISVAYGLHATRWTATRLAQARAHVLESLGRTRAPDSVGSARFTGLTRVYALDFHRCTAARLSCPSRCCCLRVMLSDLGEIPSNKSNRGICNELNNGLPLDQRTTTPL